MSATRKSMAVDDTGFPTTGNLVSITPECHPSCAVEVFYDKSTGELDVTCCECEEPVACFKIAEE
jgi:hypothetical protein